MSCTKQVFKTCSLTTSSVVQYSRLFNTLSNEQKNIKKKYEFSKPFHDLCSQHLLIGQHKQQALWHWLTTSRDITNWNINADKSIFSLSSATNTEHPEIQLPLQLIGTYSSNTNSFLFAYNNQTLKEQSFISLISDVQKKFPDISEFQNSILENQMSSDIGYILSSVILSILNMNHSGYYACPIIEGANSHQQLFVFLKDMLFCGYDEKQWLSFKSMDIFNIFANTVYRLSRQCNIHMNDHLLLFEYFFKSYGIIYKIEHFNKNMKDEEGIEIEVEVQRLIILQTEFEIDNGYYEFDKSGRFLNIGIPLHDEF